MNFDYTKTIINGIKHWTNDQINKIGSSSEIIEDEFLTWLNDEKVVEPLVDKSGAIYTSIDDELYIL